MVSPTRDNPVTQWIQEIKVPAALISYTYRAIQKRFAKDLAPYNIGWGHFAILMSLYDEEGRSQDSLALSRGFDKTMIAKSVVKLEEEDLIRRRTDPADKRVKRLYLTEKSRKLRPEMERIGYEINEFLVKDFDEKESKVVLEYLRKVAMNASELESPLSASPRDR
ncbi:MarR family winged helix-turn-helix transcriptional regulator [Methanoculleus sp.]|jgi:DNA-binding MarR family transcriptional regulator|uniref:MarR family winged helix-turn-helix transcriptional regulator n=1 Tax=Methanoculleus sp. TaxID=90427 RepID=UPI00262B9805|nr:MarR family winged helix-turn-helix transcriptional regulator [Methanoculleus sp.]